MNQKLKDEATDRLFEAILSLRSVDEAYAFFEDLCTVAELKSMAQRLHVAIMLRQGSTYTDICQTTGVSTATISRVNRSLEYGADGYKLALERLQSGGHIQLAGQTGKDPLTNENH
ncbi:MAG: YerC/YecD family TrpR-related protein [Eubacteriales bacterium]|nr:YerC/YecD family TrpR-related protein [Eubacteriales bacterium]MDD3867237.1 YerC/YecD family TrpR-related protein [Eubacteriales bacterium]MDD4462080.1 YerC/YecD family TrpR-related protein [Eubacteriales bacterium]